MDAMAATSLISYSLFRFDKTPSPGPAPQCQIPCCHAPSLALQTAPPFPHLAHRPPSHTPPASSQIHSLMPPVMGDISATASLSPASSAITNIRLDDPSHRAIRGQQQQTPSAILSSNIIIIIIIIPYPSSWAILLAATHTHTHAPTPHAFAAINS